jgi:hypothetical protein
MTIVSLPLREGATANILARNTDVIAVLQQSTESHSLGRRKVHLAVEAFEASGDVALEPRVDVLKHLLVIAATTSIRLFRRMVTHKRLWEAHARLADLGEALDGKTSLGLGLGFLGGWPDNILPLAAEHFRLSFEAVNTAKSCCEFRLVLLAPGLGVRSSENIVLLQSSAIELLSAPLQGTHLEALLEQLRNRLARSNLLVHERCRVST